MALFRQTGNSLGMATALEGLGETWLKKDSQEAARHFGKAEAIRNQIGAILPRIDRPGYERAIASIQTKPGEAAFMETWGVGRDVSEFHP